MVDTRYPKQALFCVYFDSVWILSQCNRLSNAARSALMWGFFLSRGWLALAPVAPLFHWLKPHSHFPPPSLALDRIRQTGTLQKNGPLPQEGRKFWLLLIGLVSNHQSDALHGLKISLDLKKIPSRPLVGLNMTTPRCHYWPREQKHYSSFFHITFSDSN